MIGQVLDASAVAAITRGDHMATAWVTVAYADATSLYVPVLSLREVRAVRPQAKDALDDLIDHPSVIVRDLNGPDAAAVDDLLARAGTFDALAGHVVHIARTRGWPALTAAPDRLRRIDPDLPVTLV